VERQLDRNSVRLLGFAWDKSDSGVTLFGGHCRQCEQRFFPEKSICPNCGSEKHVERVDLANVGTLYSYTVVHVAPPGFVTPYLVGFVDLEDGVRVFGQIEEPSATLTIGESMSTISGVIFTRPDGVQVESFKFRRTRA
jgi:uncharacterized OB-fold protein